MVGLATGLYVLIERVTKEDPTAYVVGLAYEGVGERTSYLRLTNRSERPMLIRLPNEPKPGHLRAAVDHSIRSLVSAAVYAETWFALDGKESIDLPLLKPVNFDALDDESEMAFVVDWRFAQPILWRGVRHKRISISKIAYRRLMRGKSTKHEDDDF